jgi:hypothetical protein
MSVPQKINFRKQFKPIGFGDKPNPDTVEGHRNAMADAAETRRYNRTMKALEAQDAERQSRRGGPLSRMLRFISAYIRHKSNR